MARMWSASGFEALPSGLMKFSYGVNTFAKYQFGSLGAEGPWVLFDKGRSTLVLADTSSAPMIAATRSGDEVEVFAYPRADSQAQATVSLRQLGIQGPAYAWDWVRHTGRRIPADGSFAMLFRDGWAYSVHPAAGTRTAEVVVQLRP